MDPVITMRAIKWACATMASWCGAGARATLKSLTTGCSIAAAHIDAVIRVYDNAGNVLETHEHAGELKEW